MGGGIGLFHYSPANAIPGKLKSVEKYDIEKTCATDQNTDVHPLNPATYLFHFSCGHVSMLDNGTTLRKFTLFIHEDKNVSLTTGNNDTHTPAIQYNAWTFNSSIPAPTIRVTKGDMVSINVVNLPGNKFMHSLHMHSIHRGSIDGTMFNNQSGAIEPGKNFTYNFIADPVGLWPFHCHQMPISLHIVKGLYGHMIIDPPASESRPVMHEMNMILNGFDLTLQPNSDQLRIPTVQEANQLMAGNDTVDEEVLPKEHDNQLYAVNTQAFYYDVHPIQLKAGEQYRIYLTNMLDFDFANTFHIHGTVYNYYPSGTATKPIMTNDMLSLGQGDRGILEFKYDFPGVFMIHSHFESQSARGWEGLFKVTPSDKDQADSLQARIDKLVAEKMKLK